MTKKRKLRFTGTTPMYVPCYNRPITPGEVIEYTAEEIDKFELLNGLFEEDFEEVKQKKPEKKITDKKGGNK